MVALGMILMACGGRPEAVPVGFVNQTHHSDADLWTIWKAAQESVAQEVDLNPLEQSFVRSVGGHSSWRRAGAKYRAAPASGEPPSRTCFRNAAGGDRSGTGQSHRDDRLPATL